MTPAELKTVLDEHPLILLYFSTPTCNVCKVLRPRVEALLKIARLSRHFGMHELEQPVRRYAELFKQTEA